MGRFKAEKYWWVPGLAGVGIIGYGLYTMVLEERADQSKSSFSSSYDLGEGVFFLFIGGIVCFMAAQAWAKHARRIQIPDDVRRIAKLDKKLKAGEITQAEYDKKRAKLERIGG